MTMEPEVSQEKKFVRVVLPWLIAAGALATYLLTLNRWVSFSSLLPVAQVSGWTWLPELHAPVYWLVTYPLRWLPAKSIPLALNLFSALCAVLTLALLARSVALLPHDRTHDQRQREKSKFALLSIPAAWLPPVLAVLVCGLQLTFWENATTASGGAFPTASAEMFDLLLFAYIVRCLLEFRIELRESWLIRAVFIYGAAMTNNWAMIAFLPLFLVALIWIQGLNFFNVRFLSRMFFWGLGGLSFYLLLPLVQSLSGTAPMPFWQGLKYNLGGQQYILAGLFRYFKSFKMEALKLGIPSLFPIFVLSMRWASYFGDTSRLGVALTTLIFRVVHGLFLLVCIWTALDPSFSPRFNELSKGFGIRFLPLSYLGALSVGYFSGYLLLLFGGKKERPTRAPLFGRLLNSAVTGAVWLLLVLTPAILIHENLPQIRATNGPLLKQYASLVAKGLPPEGGILLADPDVGNVSRRLLLMQSAVTQTGRAKDFMFLDTAALKLADYHRFLRKKYPGRWAFAPPKEGMVVADTNLVHMIAGLARTNRVCYLHPSFGYYFELLYPEPHGLAYRLKSYPDNTLITPLLSKELMAENEAFWAKADQDTLKPLLAAMAPRVPGKDPGLMDQFMKLAQLKPEPNRDASVLATFYSRALDYWGVEIQRNGELTAAAAHFQRAQDLNPDNVIAKVNLECNQNLQAGRKTFVQIPQAITDEFGKYRNWDQVMGENGPFDQPKFCYEQGRLYVRNGLYRQAANQFDRVVHLAPENMAARLWLAQLYVLSQMPDQALKIVEEIHAQPALLPVPRTNQTELLSVEASAYLAKNDLKGAESTVEKVLARYSGDQQLLPTATQVFLNYSRYSNAIMLLDKELRIDPDNLSALVTKGYACLQIGDFEQAIPPLTRVLSIETNNSEVHYSALLNRAIAYLRSDQLDEAQHDYEALQKAFPTAYRVYYGLGDIAYRKKETNAAIRNYELYLNNSPTNTEERKFVSERLKELKPHSP